MVVWVAVLLLTGHGALKALLTGASVLISLGCFCIGLAEGINHPFQTGFLPPNAYQPGGVLTGHPRRASAVGNLLLLLGLILTVFGIVRLFRGNMQATLGKQLLLRLRF